MRYYITKYTCISYNDRSAARRYIIDKYKFLLISNMFLFITNYRYVIYFYGTRSKPST